MEKTPHRLAKKSIPNLHPVSVKRYEQDIQHEEVSSTTRDDEMANKKEKRRKNKFPAKIGKEVDKSDILRVIPRTTLLIRSGTAIVGCQFSPDEIGKPSEALVKNMESLAVKLHENEVSVYKQQKERTKKSDSMWVRKVVSSGTLRDKVAALTLLIQDSPLHNVSNLETLINMARKKGRRENAQAIEALQELFLTNILPDANPLLSFDQRPLDRLSEMTSGHKDAFDRTLLTWYLESQIKAMYLLFVKAIETLTFDTVPASKKSAIDVVYKLLLTRPEQQQLLLSILVNKMGDHEHKIASKAASLLSNLISYKNHPNLKGVAVKEVENLLYRPNVSSRAQFYAICFLGQIILSHDEFELANKLISIHLSFFKAYLKQGEVDSKMMSSLLYGVNRAYPFSRVGRQKINDLTSDLYRLVHTINFNTSVQALLLLYQVHDSTDDESDRYYTAIYRKTMDPGLKNSSKHHLFLNLLFKTMTTDKSNDRIKAFIKRLLQVCAHQLPPFICGALFLISEVLKRNTHLSLNKQIRYTAETAETAETASYDDVDDDGLEHLVDAPNPDSDNEDRDIANGDKRPTTAGVSSWIHRPTKQAAGSKADSNYDPLYRNPRYCHIDRECVWELRQLANHYHPSVVIFAKTILLGAKISYDGDPLKDFTFIRFLHRFAYKNPKRSTSDSGSAATQRRRDYKPAGLRGLPLRSTAYLETSEMYIPPEEKFLYTYLKNREAIKPSEKDSDDESIGDDEFDTFLEKSNLKEKFSDDLDFAGELGKQKSKRKKGEEESDDNHEDDDEGDDEDIEFDDNEMKSMMADGDDNFMDDGNDFGAFNEEDVEFSDDDFGDIGAAKKKQRKHIIFDEDDGTGPRKKKKKFNESDLFAAAEEFSSVLDDNTSLATDMIGSSAVSNREGASVKQLKWEAKQERSMKQRGGDRRRKGDVKPKKANSFMSKPKKQRNQTLKKRKTKN